MHSFNIMFKFHFVNGLKKQKNIMNVGIYSIYIFLNIVLGCVLGGQGSKFYLSSGYNLVFDLVAFLFVNIAAIAFMIYDAIEKFIYDYRFGDAIIEKRAGEGKLKIGGVRVLSNQLICLIIILVYWLSTLIILAAFKTTRFNHEIKILTGLSLMAGGAEILIFSVFILSIVLIRNETISTFIGIITSIIMLSGILSGPIASKSKFAQIGEVSYQSRIQKYYENSEFGNKIDPLIEDLKNYLSSEQISDLAVNGIAISDFPNGSSFGNYFSNWQFLKSESDTDSYNGIKGVKSGEKLNDFSFNKTLISFVSDYLQHERFDNGFEFSLINSDRGIAGQDGTSIVGQEILNNYRTHKLISVDDVVKEVSQIIIGLYENLQQYKEEINLESEFKSQRHLNYYMPIDFGDFAFMLDNPRSVNLNDARSSMQNPSIRSLSVSFYFNNSYHLRFNPTAFAVSLFVIDALLVMITFLFQRYNGKLNN